MKLYYRTSTAYTMTEAWRPGYPKTTGRFCVNARLGYEPNVRYCTVQYSVQYSAVLYPPNVSWVHKSCEDTSWDAAPCSACSLAASVQVNTEFKLLGLCERYRIDVIITLTL